MLTGGKNIVIDEKQKESVDLALKSGSDHWIHIGADRIKSSTIKGIFSMEDDSEKLKAWSDNRFQMDKKWSDEMFALQSLSPEEKTKRELKVRIFPRAFVNKGWIATQSTTGKLIENLVLVFFQEHPEYPRCPAKIWWDIFKTIVTKNTGTERFYRFVAYNDSAIAEWVKYHRLPNNQVGI